MVDSKRCEGNSLNFGLFKRRIGFSPIYDAIAALKQNGIFLLPEKISLERVGDLRLHALAQKYALFRSWALILDRLLY